MALGTYTKEEHYHEWKCSSPVGNAIAATCICGRERTFPSEPEAHYPNTYEMKRIQRLKRQYYKELRETLERILEE